MKISEQAAFVKEVISQEAMRAARREGKEIEAILKEVEAQAQGRLSPTVEGEPEAPVEPVLFEEEIEPTPPRIIEGEIEKEPRIELREELEAEPDADKLSMYELEELRMDLVRRGIAPHEIDTIMDQVRELPRDLVEELLRSVGIEPTETSEDE